MKWAGYVPTERLPYWVLADVPRAVARAEFEAGIAGRVKRIEQLRRLMSANGVQISDHSQEAVQKVNDFFIDAMEPNPERPSVPNFLSHSLCEDVSWLIGETMIERNPGLHWVLFTWGKKNVAYHLPYVTGFTGVPERFHFGYDLVQLIGLYAEEILQRRGYVEVKEVVSIRGNEIDLNNMDPFKHPFQKDYFNYLLNAAEEINNRERGDRS